MRAMLLAGLVTGMLAASPLAHAEGLGVEGTYARADGHWGTELGAGYAIGAGGFSVTPGGGVFIRDGATKLYGRVEASYDIPLFATVGVGMRLSNDNLRPYATASFPLFQRLAIKANAGPHYYAIGLRFGY